MSPRTPIVSIAGRKNHGKDTVAHFLVSEFDFKQIAFADPIKRLAMTLFSLDEDTLWGASAKRERKLKEALHLQGVDVNERYWLYVLERMDENAQGINALFHEIKKQKIEHCPDALPSLAGFIRSFASKSEEVTVRHVLQQLGTEWGRKLWPVVWCYHALCAINDLRNGSGYNRLIGTIPNQGGPKPKGFVISDCRFPDNETLYVQDNGGCIWWVDASKRLLDTYDASKKREHASEPYYEDFVDAGCNPLKIMNNGTPKDLRLIVRAEAKKVLEKAG